MNTPSSNVKRIKNLSRAQFWDIIKDARNHDLEKKRHLDEAIMQVLEDLCENEALAQFQLHVENLREELPGLTFGVAMDILPYQDIFGAPYRQCRNWIIAQGQEKFEKVVQDPTYLKHIASPRSIRKEGLPLLQELDHVASAVHFDRKEQNPSIEDWEELLDKEQRQFDLNRILEGEKTAANIDR